MNLLSIYPSQLEYEIIRRKIVLRVIPECFRLIESRFIPDKPIKNARKLHEHILSESRFWTPELVKNNVIVSHYPDALAAALSAFDELIHSNTTYLKEKLDTVLGLLRACEIGSKTKLAQIFKQHQNESPQFFRGFLCAFGYRTEILNAYNIFRWQPPSRYFG